MLYERPLSRLCEVGALGKNWDGKGSPGTHKDIFDAAKTMLRRLNDAIGSPFPSGFVRAIAGGTLQFSWSLPDRHVEVEFIDKDDVEMRVIKKSAGQTDETWYVLAADRINYIVQRLQGTGAGAK